MASLVEGDAGDSGEGSAEQGDEAGVGIEPELPTASAGAGIERAVCAKVALRTESVKPIMGRVWPRSRQTVMGCYGRSARSQSG